MSDIRTMIQEVLAESYDHALQILTEFAKENPDVYRRGAAEFLKPRMTAEVTLPIRKELQTMDEEALLSAIDQMVQATSEEEAMQVLNGGRR